MTAAGDVDAVEKLVRDRLGEPSLWAEPDGYPDSLALCAIDSVYSLQSHYTATVNVLDRYRAYRREQGGEPGADGVPELLTAIQEVGGPTAAADGLFRNRANAPGTRRLKSEALAEAVARLADVGVETTTHLRSADTSRACMAGQGPGVRLVGLPADAVRGPGGQGGQQGSEFRDNSGRGERPRFEGPCRAGGEGRGGTAWIDTARPRPRDLAVPADCQIIMITSRVLPATSTDNVQIEAISSSASRPRV
jgi:hypothetical protein